VTTRVRLARKAGLLLLAAACLLSVVSVQSRPPSPAIAPAADTTAFRPDNIISDAVFFDSGAMTAGQIQTFLNNKVPTCRAAAGAPTCLKSYRQSTPTRAADSFCNAYAGAQNELAAAIIAKVSKACDINPRVLLVTLQKEMGFVTSTAPTAKMYTRAMGFGCPDSSGGTCDSTYNGLFNQLYTAAKQFQRYAANPTRYGYRVGVTNNIQYNPNAACGTKPVVIRNQATAGLYNYTPYVPNAAALAAGYGTSSNSCSSYGNRNFWLYFTDWFGSTQTLGRDINAPGGSLDAATGTAATLTVNGWALDPDQLATSINVHVYVDGVLAAGAIADKVRNDIAAARPGAGALHGFSASVSAEAGDRTVCVYAINVGAGYTNPLLGCRTVTVKPASAANPVGQLDPVSTSGTTVTATGWTFDPDVPTATVTVHVYVDGAVVAAVQANGARPEIGTKYPQAGAAHGFSWSGTVAGGAHQVCVFAINQKIGSANPRLGCQAVTVIPPSPAASNPVGRLDGATVSGTTASVGGWAFDPDVPTAPVTVHVYVDGRVVGAATANGARPDVGRVYATAGAAHGFTWSGTVPVGTHQVCTYAINQGAGTTNPKLGCRTVTVSSSSSMSSPGTGSPVGRLDGARVSGTTATVSGWVFDPDVPTAPVTVHVYVDGRVTGAATANAPRSDVGRAYPTAGPNHGYIWSGTLAPGKPHQICAFAINQGGGTGNPRLGCATVTVP
jgi:hypothetical protein